MEICNAKPLVPEPSPFVAENAAAKLKQYKSLGTVHLNAEMIQAEGETLCSEIHKLINSIWNKEELPQ
jgi:hypothetical protein